MKVMQTCLLACEQDVVDNSSTMNQCISCFGREVLCATAVTIKKLLQACCCS